MRLDTREWDRTFPRYMKRTRRDLATVLNTKLFYIARRATVETPKADKSAIQKLREARKKTTFTKRGKPKIINTTAAALIIQARRANEGKKPLKNAEAKKEGSDMVKARLRSIAFLKSGYLPAIKRLEPLADRKGIPRQDKSGKQVGRPKGFARPARDGSWRPSAMLQNDALPKTRGGLLKRMFGDKRAGAMKFAGPALQRAFDHEVRSMKDYLFRKLQAGAKREGIKTG